MVSKGYNKISVDADTAANVLRKLKTAHDSPGLPTGASFVVQRPVAAPAVNTFNAAIDVYGRDLAKAVELLRLRLSELHDDINKTVSEFAASDAAVADEATLMMGSIGSPPATPVVTPPATSTTGWG